MVLSFFEETLPYTVITWRWSTHVIWAGSLNVLLKHPGAFKHLKSEKKLLVTYLPFYLVTYGLRTKKFVYLIM